MARNFANVVLPVREGPTRSTSASFHISGLTPSSAIKAKWSASFTAHLSSFTKSSESCASRVSASPTCSRTDLVGTAVPEVVHDLLLRRLRGGCAKDVASKLAPSSARRGTTWGCLCQVWHGSMLVSRGLGFICSVQKMRRRARLSSSDLSNQHEGCHFHIRQRLYQPGALCDDDQGFDSSAWRKLAKAESFLLPFLKEI